MKSIKEGEVYILGDTEKTNEKKIKGRPASIENILEDGEIEVMVGAHRYKVSIQDLLGVDDESQVEG